MDKLNKIEDNSRAKLNTNFEEIFYQSPIGIFFYDKSGRLTNANDSALKIARIPRLDNILGTNLFDNPKIASKKEDLHEKGLIRFKDSLNLIKIKEQEIYNPIETKIIELDWTVSVTDSGYLIQIQDISDRKKSETDLKVKEVQFDVLTDNLQLGVALINETGRFALVNPAFMEIFGLDNKLDILNVNNQDWSQWKVYGEDSKLLDVDEHPVRKVAITGKSIRDQLVKLITPNDNQFKWLLISAIPILNEDNIIKMIICTYYDVTSRKNDEEALLISEEKYRNIVETANEGILIADTSGIITFANPKISEMLGYSKKELLGTNGLFIIDNESLQIQEKIENRKKGIAESYEIKLIRKDGTELWTVVSASPMYDHTGIHMGNLAMYTDITQRKKSENEIEKTMDELKRSNQELQRFAYVSSHDFQEPLRMVTLYSQLLERRYKDTLDSDADDFIEYIVEGSNRMRQLIDDLLEYSRVTSQAKEFENVKLEKVLDTVLTNLSMSIVENNVKVTHEPLPIVFADTNQMLQVFQNLITNAIKFRGVKPPEISISVKKGQYEWVFVISDNGIGIKPEHQKQIFDVFKRLHTKEEYPGTGIGLSIVQKIIKHHGGRIWVESELGKGSTFYFTILEH